MSSQGGATCYRGQKTRHEPAPLPAVLRNVSEYVSKQAASGRNGPSWDQLRLLVFAYGRQGTMGDYLKNRAHMEANHVLAI